MKKNPLLWLAIILGLSTAVSTYAAKKKESIK